jgi:hypothetical protein
MAGSRRLCGFTPLPLLGVVREGRERDRRPQHQGAPRQAARKGMPVRDRLPGEESYDATIEILSKEIKVNAPAAPTELVGVERPFFLLTNP